MTELENIHVAGVVASVRRTVVLDTETTGFLHDDGDKIIEIGAIEYIDRAPTGRTFHVYVDPQRDVPEEAYEVHGLSRDELMKLSGGKIFADIAQDFVEFIRGAEMVAHNAGFDENFLNAELKAAGYKPVREYDVAVTDSLQIANAKHPGQSNSLDALLKRYLGADNFARDFHGALLDASLLARVYLLMTVKQNNLGLEASVVNTTASIKTDRIEGGLDLPLVQISDEDHTRHRSFLSRIARESGKDAPSFG